MRGLHQRLVNNDVIKVGCSDQCVAYIKKKLVNNDVVKAGLQSQPCHEKGRDPREDEGSFSYFLCVWEGKCVGIKQFRL